MAEPPPKDESFKTSTTATASAAASDAPNDDDDTAAAGGGERNEKAAPTPPSSANAASATATTAQPSSSSSSSSVEEARARIGGWIDKNSGAEIALDVRVLLKDYDSLKEKAGKLKSLLGRSAKAQREAKVEVEVTRKRLDAALREIDRLNTKVDKLANRPTHMELLADFETNFDRALLSVGHHQAGGEDTAPPPSSPPPAGMAAAGGGSGGDFRQNREDDDAVDNLLMQELNDSKRRVEKLESLNAALLQRSAQLENESKQHRRERDELASKASRLELEKRMAVMEAEHATKAMEEKAASLKEMQMEIDMVTRASMTANARAAQGEELMKSVKTDKQHVQQLESKVQALQEWALASSEAKNLAQERVRFLESQLRAVQQHQHQQGRRGSANTKTDGSSELGESQEERVLFVQKASMVVGAGDVAARVFSLDEDAAKSVKLSERVVLRWQFDLLQEDATIQFSMLKGSCESPDKRRASDAGAPFIIKDRTVTGGAAGETENSFEVGNRCTLVWSNGSAWVRPKTVKYVVEAVAVPY